MDGLTTCKTCSKEVALSATTCPHCGAKLKMSFMEKLVLYTFVSVILFFLLFTLFVEWAR